MDDRSTTCDDDEGQMSVSENVMCGRMDFDMKLRYDDGDRGDTMNPALQRRDPDEGIRRTRP